MKTSMEKPDIIIWLSEASEWIYEMAGASERSKPSIQNMLSAINDAIIIINETKTSA